ncbi:tRNA (adenosine(37)-N6)-threonylcarbamoyltransferase complex dimerization subunit type 1 TsaB [Treponema endosymbiont of Eucomonympha sp.]|uniref:tRNA (adenosine(37)-N6)-threonylcarbamoyltransferase complex dimerization subunit type 1 TsaB n=1 Tax=Treponema endosymbiont of Eucomonympha sp. TaxID=1580831 RepID=UPI000750EC14|nr:tRNA (adenosine(37)-N6)-threonylcarbamoyltransferase complex dimerization subunit type 1 TsaB [Treponema endosymbiont of Eucomonympha sp.]
MKALALDTASMRVTVAAKDGDKTASVTLALGTHQSKKLLPAVIYVLEQAGFPPESLDYAAVTGGPGSFTSLRLGFAAAKALCLACNVPVYAVPTLAAYAEPFRAWKSAVVPALDAKRNRFYAAVYRLGKAARAAGDYAPEELALFLDAEEPVIAAGPDAALLQERLLSCKPLLDVRAAPASSAEALFALAERMIARGDAPCAEDAAPEYLRGARD